MNQLDPQLKRLMNRARGAAEESTVAAPAGFSNRVVARWNTDQANDAAAVWQKAVLVSAWASAVVILCGAALFASRTRPADTAYDFTATLQVVAKNIVP